MTERSEKTRAGAATPTRAVETGAASRQTTTSTNDFNTSPAERQPFRIADLLHPGAENATPRRDLMAMTGCRDRELRRLIEAERRQGTPILSNCVGGYYLPETQAERKKCVASLRRRAKEIERTADAIESSAGW